MTDHDLQRTRSGGASPDPYLRLLDASRHDDAVHRRTATRDLRLHEAELATFGGVVHDLAEARARVTLRLATGRELGGRLTAIGVDHLALLGADDAILLVRTSAVAALLMPPGDPGGSLRDAGSLSGDRAAPQHRLLLDVLTGLHQCSDDVAVGLLGSPDPMRGRLRAIGEDVVSLQVAGRGRILIAAAALTDVAWWPR